MTKLNNLIKDLTSRKEYFEVLCVNHKTEYTVKLFVDCVYEIDQYIKYLSDFKKYEKDFNVTVSNQGDEGLAISFRITENQDKEK